MQNRPLLLLTNDDGYDAKGLASLVDMLRDFADLVVVAPDGPRSAQANAITVVTPIRIWKLEEREGLVRYKCSGTPADCVKIALYALLPKKPDMLIAGINHGTNTSVNVIYSGTMGAVMEGCTERFPAIGFSLDSHDPNADFEPCRTQIRKMVRRALSEGLPEGVCLNVNFPVRPTFKGVRVVRQCRGRWNERYVRRTDPSGREYFWLTGEFLNYEPDATDTDEAVTKAGYVSVVPCQIDLTHKDSILKLKNWNDD
ncbi:MAG: 5'/3'-nucleotidase SurE [Paludibacteraceae bacterium]|nr:5'/3'-nucleotidase SurE [Paludibacteraceae bacterium]